MAFFIGGGGVFWLFDWLGFVYAPYTPPLLGRHGRGDVPQTPSQGVEFTPSVLDEEWDLDIPLPVPFTPRNESTSFAESHNDFAIALHNRLRERAHNLFFSPLSVRTALAMAFAGARGETAAQMAAVLRFASSDDSLHSAFADVISRLATGSRQSVAIANSLWAQDGSPLEATFLDTIARHYRGQANLVDFVGDAEGARQTINQWASESTGDRIREVIPPGAMDPDERLVLTNAVYFKGRWMLRFPASATRRQRFYTEGGGTVGCR
jgi:serpin B